MRNSDAYRLLIRLSMFVPLLLGPGALNWILALPGMDTRSLPVYDQFAAALLSGRSIRLDTDLRPLDADLRPLKAAFLRLMPARKAVLILGSSRAATIAAEWFPAADAWNAAVASGGIDDAVTLFEICVELNRIPSTVILELSAPGLMDRSRVRNRPAFELYRDRALARYSIIPPALQFPCAEFSWNQTSLNLRVAAGKFGQAADMSRQSAAWSEVLPDGRIVFRDWFVKTPAQIGPIVARSIADAGRDELEWRGRSEPDRFAARIFRRFLDDLHSRGIRVIVFLAPVNPLA